MSPRRSASEAAATRQRLLDVGRELFADPGFTAAGTADLVARAGVTRGALYHHFPDKTALFAAVFEAVEIEVAHRVDDAARAGTDAMGRLRLGFGAFLDACLEPDIARIMLVDAPSVLGWDAWYEVDQRYGFDLVVRGLRTAMAGGALEPQPVDALAHLLLGAVTQAGMVLARAERPETTRADVGEALGRLLDGLAPRTP